MVEEEIIEAIYWCDYCSQHFDDEDRAEDHEEECENNPKVKAELQRLADIEPRKKLGLEVPEEENPVPKTLSMTKEQLAGNLTLDA